ncbi:MAG: hypothetical protein GX637_09010, partial [Clostridiales bacterium]|nr:hypothetical protein [Clostridiales bacterium]
MNRRMRWLISVILLVLLPVSALAAPTASSVYASMIALKDEYYEGRPWTNDNFYAWKGGIFSGGYGCAGFAFILSDAAFGSLPARQISDVHFDDVRVGDILRINGNTHSVVVLQKYSDHVTLAEGNYNASIHWGRSYSKASVEAADYYLTRYPAAAVKITAQPQSVVVSAAGVTAKTTVTATGDGLTYQWYVKDLGSSSFTKSSNTTKTYSVALTAAKSGRQVYCVVGDKYGNTVQSNTATLSIAEAVKITTQPKSVTVAKAGDTARTTVTATGDGLIYQWYVKDLGSSAFSKSSNTTKTYSVALTAAKSGRQVYCVVGDKYGNTVQSNTATL